MRRLFDLLIVIAEMLVDIHHVSKILYRVRRDSDSLQPLRGIPLAQTAGPLRNRGLKLFLTRLAPCQSL